MLPRITNQKKIILNYLKSVKTHPSVESVYNEVKEQLPQISLATVYRNLKDLKEKGEIQEIPARSARYDGDTSNHAHFICEKCQTILDICPIFENESPPSLRTGHLLASPREAKRSKKSSQCGHSNGAVRIFTASCPFLNPQKIKVGKINKYQINIYGLCKKCSQE